MNMDYKELIKGTQLFENDPVAHFYDEYMEEKNFRKKDVLWQNKRKNQK